MPTITDHQRRQIFSLCRELGWNDEMRHDMVREWTGKLSLADDAANPVTEGEARRILWNLSKAVAQVRRERRGKGLRQRRTWNKPRLTPEQLRKLGILKRLVFGTYDAGFRTWLRKRYGTEEPGRLTVEQATAAIVGLEKMQADGWRPRLLADASSAPSH